MLHVIDNRKDISYIVIRIYYDRHSTLDRVEVEMISSDVIRGYVDTMILYFLFDEPSYAYELSRRIRQRAQEKYALKETTLYSALSRLEQSGYVESYRDDSSGKRRTYYRINTSGREYYETKCREWALIQDIIERFIR